MRLEGKAALITGVDSSLGRQIAIHFAQEGARVAGVGDSSDGSSAIQEIQQQGGTGVYVEADISESAGAEKAVAGALDAFGRIDAVINYNSVRRILGTVVDITDEDFEEEMTSDLMRIIRLAHYAIPAMAKGGGGSYVNFSSINSDGLEGRAMRSAGKAAVNALSIAMALDHGRDHIRVNAILMGPKGSADPSAAPDPASPIGKSVTPEEVGAAAAFLASDEAGSITGILLRLDGGRSLRAGAPTP